MTVPSLPFPHCHQYRMPSPKTPSRPHCINRPILRRSQPRIRSRFPISVNPFVVPQSQFATYLRAEVPGFAKQRDEGCERRRTLRMHGERGSPLQTRKGKEGHTSSAMQARTPSPSYLSTSASTPPRPPCDSCAASASLESAVPRSPSKSGTTFYQRFVSPHHSPSRAERYALGLNLLHRRNDTIRPHPSHVYRHHE